VIAAMGGNVGAQSTTIFVRGLVLGHVDTDNFWIQFFREIYRTGLGIGLFFGGFVGLCAWVWQFYLRSIDQPEYALFFGLAVGVAMFLAIVAASALGFLIPYVVHRIGADPAAASNPLLTTVQDVVGLVIYFSSAAYFLSFV
jgi:magnesium transporter